VTIEARHLFGDGRDHSGSFVADPDVEINGLTIVAVNGQAVALAGPHGQSYRAI
jgi:hypothetical protein